MGLYIDKFMAFALMAVSAACASTDEVALKSTGAVPTKAAVMVVTPKVSSAKTALRVQPALATMPVTVANITVLEEQATDTKAIATELASEAHSCNSFCGLPSKYRPQ